jgi:hypothetical protein
MMFIEYHTENEFIYFITISFTFLQYYWYIIMKEGL